MQCTFHFGTPSSLGFYRILFQAVAPKLQWSAVSHQRAPRWPLHSLRICCLATLSDATSLTMQNIIVMQHAYVRDCKVFLSSELVCCGCIPTQRAMAWLVQDPLKTGTSMSPLSHRTRRVNSGRGDIEHSQICHTGQKSQSNSYEKQTQR